MQLNFFQNLKIKSLHRRTVETSDQQWLDTQHIDILRRPWQRSISVRVRPSGLVRVTCSKTCSVSEIQKFLLTNREWVSKSQKEFERIRERYPKKQFVPEELFLFRGQWVPLVMENIKSKKKPKFYVLNDQLIFTHNLEKYSWGELKNWLRDAYKKSAIKSLGESVEQVSSEMGLFPTMISYRSQRTRWGSCSSDGRVSLNWKLEAAPKVIARYVIVHELAHLKYQDHSPKFWQLVQSHCPEFKTHRKWLNENQYEMDFLAKKSELHL